MPKKYAILINERTHALVRVMSSLSEQATMPQENNTYFLFTVVDSNTTTDHDVMDEDSLYAENGHLEDQYVILMG